MVYFALPDAEAPPPYQIIQVATKADSENSDLVERSYGVCSIGHSGSGPRSVSLGISHYLLDFHPKDMQTRLKNNTLNEFDAEFLDGWERSRTITLLREPQHGKITGKSTGYTADEGFIGVDQVELLVEGKDAENRPLKVKLVYSIKVISKEDFRKAGKDGSIGHKLCPKELWVIPMRSVSLNSHEIIGPVIFENFASRVNLGQV